MLITKIKVAATILGASCASRDQPSGAGATVENRETRRSRLAGTDRTDRRADRALDDATAARAAARSAEPPRCTTQSA